MNNEYLTIQCRHEDIVRIETIDMNTGLPEHADYNCFDCGTYIGGVNMVKVPVSLSYLGKEDFKGDSSISGSFADEGSITPAKDSKWGREQFKIQVLLSTGEKRIANLNNTSRELLTNAYGEDSKSWLGKECVIQGSEEMVAKRMVWVIYVRPKKS